MYVCVCVQCIDKYSFKTTKIHYLNLQVNSGGVDVIKKLKYHAVEHFYVYVIKILL